MAKYWNPGVYFAPEDRAIIEAAATEAGVTVSSFIIGVVMDSIGAERTTKEYGAQGAGRRASTHKDEAETTE